MLTKFKHVRSAYIISISDNKDLNISAKFDSGATISYMILGALEKYNIDDYSRLSIITNRYI